MIVSRRLCLASSAAIAAVLVRPAPAQGPTDWSPSATEVRQALGSLASAVESSARIHGPVLGDVGQFAVRVAGGGDREVGVYVRAYRFPLNQTPPFWINVVENLGQVVLRVRDAHIDIEQIPSDWLASDYIRERKPEPAAISFIALNPRRHVRTPAGERAIIAESDFITRTNVLARARFWIDTTARETRALSIMVYDVSDEREARRLLDALDKLRG